MENIKTKCQLLRSGKHKASINVTGEWRNLGHFPDADQAQAACDKAKKYLIKALNSQNPAMSTAIFWWKSAGIIPNGAKL